MDAASRYEWNAGNLAKCQTHGVTIAEIEHVLDSDPFLAPDHRHSELETRNIAVGPNGSGRPIFVIFTNRIADGRELVRPISARYMHRKEIERYAKLWRTEGTNTED